MLGYSNTIISTSLLPGPATVKPSKLTQTTMFVFICTVVTWKRNPYQFLQKIPTLLWVFSQLMSRDIQYIHVSQICDNRRVQLQMDRNMVTGESHQVFNWMNKVYEYYDWYHEHKLHYRSMLFPLLGLPCEFILQQSRIRCIKLDTKPQWCIRWWQLLQYLFIVV